MTSKLDHALKYAAMNIRVFPIVENSKTPALEDWPGLATTDEKQIRAWWKAVDWNIGIATGRGVMAIDADTKQGAPGLDSLNALDLEMLPVSFRVRTPSGGTHVLLRTDADVQNRVKSVEGYDGIDIRGERGFIVGAGSTIDGKAYEIVEDRPIEPAPADFIEVLGKRPAHRAKTELPVVELDQPANVERAKQWLETWPAAIEGEGGDDHTYRTAARIRDFGLSEGMALDVLGAWSDRCEPPWTAEDLAEKIAHAFSYASGTWGGRTAEADFDPVDIGDDAEAPTAAEIERAGAVPAEVKKAAKNKAAVANLHLIEFDEMADNAILKPYEPVIDKVLDAHTLAVLYGTSGTTKTFNAINMGLAIATGRPWAGKYETRQGAVCYMAGEGAEGLERRMRAARLHYDIPRGVPFAMFSSMVNMMGNQEGVAAAADEARRYAKNKGVPLRLIIIDTLATAMAGGDENASKDMGVFIDSMRLLRNRTKATILVIHHTGKMEDNGSRGSTALPFGVDAMFYLKRTGEIVVEKEKDMAKGHITAISRLVPVEIGRDPNGRMLESAAIEYVDADFGEVPVEELDGYDLFFEVFTTLSRKSFDAGLGGWLTRKQCQDAYNERQETLRGPGKETGQRTISGWLQKMVSLNHVRELDGGNGSTKRFNLAKT